MALRQIQEAMMDFLESSDSDFVALEQAVSKNSVQRLNVYRNGYRIRQSNLLKQAYPALQHLLGAKLFSGLTQDYLKATPVRESSGVSFIENLPIYMCQQLGEKEAVVELAEFEQVIHRVSLQPEEGVLSRADWVGVLSRGEENNTAFCLQSCAQVIVLRFNTLESWTALLDKKKVPDPITQSGSVLVWRDEESRVLTQSLSSVDALFLESLVAGCSLEAACDSVSRYYLTEQAAAEQISQQLMAWIDQGLFARVVQACIQQEG